ncbi:hypothetical protein ACFX14_018183 [Malus domestica]
MPKRARPSIITNQVIKSTSSTTKNYSAACLYYHQPGDQKYVQYSKIIRQPAAIITNQVIKSTPSTSKLFGSLPLLSPTKDSLTIIREHRRLLSNRLAASINSSLSFKY